MLSPDLKPALVALTLVALAGARPADVPRMELADVLGHTACPLRVHTDDDPLRVPRRIQFLSCDRAAMAAGAACCGRLGPGAGCVEVYDSVLVQYAERAGADARAAPRHVVQVPVGCACVLRAPSRAADADD